MAWVRDQLCKLQKGCTRLAAARDKAYQLLAHGRWFSPSTPASSTTKTGRRDIAQILLKMALTNKNQIKANIRSVSCVSGVPSVSYIFSCLCCVVFFCLRPVFCVSVVASVSGLSILDCPFGFL